MRVFNFGIRNKPAINLGIAKCDKCLTGFKINLLTKSITANDRKVLGVTYFKCSNCGEIYISMLVDDKQSSMIKQRVSLEEKERKLATLLLTAKNTKSLEKQIEKLKISRRKIMEMQKVHSEQVTAVYADEIKLTLRGDK